MHVVAECVCGNVHSGRLGLESVYIWEYLHLQGQLVAMHLCLGGKGRVRVLGGTAQECIALTIQFEGIEPSNKYLLSPTVCRGGGKRQSRGVSMGGILGGRSPIVGVWGPAGVESELRIWWW